MIDYLDEHLFYSDQFFGFHKQVSKILYCDRIDLTEGIDVTKNNSKECTICHYWYFKQGFKFQKQFCTGCCDSLILSLDISNIAIITVKYIVYRCIISDFSKSDTIHLF